MFNLQSQPTPSHYVFNTPKPKLYFQVMYPTDIIRAQPIVYRGLKEKYSYKLKYKKPNEYIKTSETAKPDTFNYEELDGQRLKLIYANPTRESHQHRESDIKPVVEEIEGDIKYDFRTRTHSYD